VAFLYPPQYFHLLKPSIRPKNWAVYLDKCEIAFFSYFNKKDMAIQVDAYPDILLEDVVETRGYEQQIIKYVSQFVQLSPVETQAIIENLYVRTFKKGATLLREGQYSPLCYFILKGCVRKYYLVDGEEKTTHFYTEGEPISSYQGTFKRAPAKFYLSCVEDTIPKFETVCRIATEEEVGKSQETIASLIINSPEERYLKLLKTRPHLLERVPQYQIASYLGLTPESLSRLRKRLLNRRTNVFLTQRQ
jgi:CRP-like cAMP-binding protein